MSPTQLYDAAVDSTRSGVRAVGEHLPIDAVTHLDWSDVPLADLDLDDVLDDVQRVVRRYPLAILAIVVASVAATCSIVMLRRRRRANDHEADLYVAGAA